MDLRFSSQISGQGVSHELKLNTDASGLGGYAAILFGTQWFYGNWDTNWQYKILQS